MLIVKHGVPAQQNIVSTVDYSLESVIWTLARKAKERSDGTVAYEVALLMVTYTTETGDGRSLLVETMTAVRNGEPDT